MPSQPVLTSSAIRVERRGLARGLAWAALAFLVVPILLLALLSPVGPDWLVPLYPILGAAPLMAPIAGIASLAARVVSASREGDLSVDGEKLSVRRGGRERKIPLSRIAEGWLEPSSSEVVLRLRSGDLLRAQIHDDEEGRRLLAAVGVDPAHQTMHMRMGDTTFLDWMVGLLGPALGGNVAMLLARADAAEGYRARVALLAFCASMAILAVGVRTAFGPADLVVGADGITISHRFRRRFVAYESIAAVRHRGRAIELVGKDGSVVRAKTRNLSPQDWARLQTRIADAMRAGQPAGVPETALAGLDRGGRSAAAWKDALATLLDRAAGYRKAELSRDQLVLALENPSTAAERRLGAAIALASTDNGIKPRIEAAAQACANRKVRIALEAAARGELDDATIEAALEQEEEESAAQARPRAALADRGDGAP